MVGGSGGGMKRDGGKDSGRKGRYITLTHAMHKIPRITPVCWWRGEERN